MRLTPSRLALVVASSVLALSCSFSQAGVQLGPANGDGSGADARRDHGIDDGRADGVVPADGSARDGDSSGADGLLPDTADASAPDAPASGKPLGASCLAANQCTSGLCVKKVDTVAARICCSQQCKTGELDEGCEASGNGCQD